eukprot:m.155384 g.155384  ORF g.155384 m.155384 type:complete len:264 (+) comp17528_c0_seq2:1751-2542(+)
MADNGHVNKRQRVEENGEAGAAGVPCATVAQRSFNPIRALVDEMDKTPNPDKPMIPLSIGDPTVFGNLVVPEQALEAVSASLRSGKANGYAPSTGYESTRQAIADAFAAPGAAYAAKDVIVASGCSGAIDLAITVLANEGQNILIPRPGFSLYKTLALSKGIEVRSYNLLPDQGWAVDLEHLASLADENTAAIVVTNPSNPCGSVLTKENLAGVLKGQRLSQRNERVATRVNSNGVTTQFRGVLSLRWGLIPFRNPQSPKRRG